MMRNRVLVAIFILFASLAPACAATLLPPGEVTFFDANGQPLSGGKVFFFVPNTSTPSDTYLDSGQTQLNTNPVVLDSAGRAIIYGAGSYREVVQDANGNLIWDQLTASTNENNYSWAGTSAGTANAQTLSAGNFSEQDGQQIGFIAGFTNTGALTLSVNGQQGINVTKATTSGQISLTGSEVVAGNQYEVIYSATAGNFQLVSYPIAPGIGAQFSIASAATTDIGTATSHNASISGSASISSLGSSASLSSPFYLLNFSGAATLVASSAIATPTGGNIVASAGATALAEYLGSGNWTIVNYSQALVPSGMVAMFNLSSCPAGWVTANGSNSTADARGRALRGLDLGAGRDPTGTGLAGGESSAVGPLTLAVSGGTLGGTIGSGSGGGSQSTPLNAESITVTCTSCTTETRMDNVVLMPCQKL